MLRQAAQDAAPRRSFHNERVNTCIVIVGLPGVGTAGWQFDGRKLVAEVAGARSDGYSITAVVPDSDGEAAVSRIVIGGNDHPTNDSHRRERGEYNQSSGQQHPCR